MVLAILVFSLFGAATPALARVEAQPSQAGGPQVERTGDLTIIRTDLFTVAFPANGTKPMFVWWANNDSGKVYVVHYKGLVEYARINGSSFRLRNMAEPSLFNAIILENNLRDEARLLEIERGIALAVSTGADLVRANILSASANRSAAVDALNQAVSNLQTIDNATGGSLPEVSAAIGKINSAISLIGSSKPSGAGSLIGDAISSLGGAIKSGLNSVRDLVKERIEERERLRELADNFHPAFLSFGSTGWELGEITEIRSGDKVIGLSFTMTLTDAPSKFDFAEGNVELAIRLYSEPVIEVGSGSGYSYNVSAGEMKMDLAVRDWEWNFEPISVSILNATGTVEPALALWIDAASYPADAIGECFKDLDEVETTSASPSVTFRGNPAAPCIRLAITERSTEAADLSVAATVTNQNLAGKNLMMAGPAKLKFGVSEEQDLVGIFKFVPFATVTDGNSSYSVPVEAAYFNAGNHIRIYISYPYFNGLLVHDPSIGLDTPQTAARYLVTVGAMASGLTVQQIPAISVWPTSEGLGLAGIIVALSAVAMIVIVRRHPAAV